MKKIKSIKQAHTPKSKIGMGDNQGIGIKQKVGTMREDMINMPFTPKRSVKRSPKSLA